MQLLRTAHPQSQRFLKIAASHLLAYGVRPVFYRNRDKSEFRIDGYFDPHNKQLAVYRQNTHSDTMSIFAHEYCHFLIWTQQNNRQTTYNITTDYDRTIERWLARKIPYGTSVKNAFRKVKNEEILCDSMALKLIKLHQLPVNISQFVMEANRQIIRYECVERTRRWIPEGNFFSDEHLNNSIPAKYIKKSYARHIPDKLVKLAMELY